MHVGTGQQLVGYGGRHHTERIDYAAGARNGYRNWTLVGCKFPSVDFAMHDLSS